MCGTADTERRTARLAVQAHANAADADEEEFRRPFQIEVDGNLCEVVVGTILTRPQPREHMEHEATVAHRLVATSDFRLRVQRTSKVALREVSPLYMTTQKTFVCSAAKRKHFAGKNTTRADDGSGVASTHIISDTTGAATRGVFHPRPNRKHLATGCTAQLKIQWLPVAEFDGMWAWTVTHVHHVHKGHADEPCVREGVEVLRPEHEQVVGNMIGAKADASIARRCVNYLLSEGYTTWTTVVQILNLDSKLKRREQERQLLVGDMDPDNRSDVPRAEDSAELLARLCAEKHVGWVVSFVVSRDGSTAEQESFSMYRPFGADRPLLVQGRKLLPRSSPLCVELDIEASIDSTTAYSRVQLVANEEAVRRAAARLHVGLGKAVISKSGTTTPTTVLKLEVNRVLWQHSSQLSELCKFPEVIMIDSTSGSNRSGLQLLMPTALNACGAFFGAVALVESESEAAIKFVHESLRYLGQRDDGSWWGQATHCLLSDGCDRIKTVHALCTQRGTQFYGGEHDCAWGICACVRSALLSLVVCWRWRGYVHRRRRYRCCCWWW